MIKMSDRAYLELLHKKLSHLVDRFQSHECFHESRVDSLEKLYESHTKNSGAHGFGDFKLLCDYLGVEIKDTPEKRAVTKKEI